MVKNATNKSVRLMVPLPSARLVAPAAEHFMGEGALLSSSLDPQQLTMVPASGHISTRHRASRNFSVAFAPGARHFEKAIEYF